MFKRSIQVLLLSIIIFSQCAYSALKDQPARIRLISSNEFKTAPLIRLVSTGGKFAQGKTGGLYFLANGTGMDITGSFQGKSFKAFPYPRKDSRIYRVLIGASIDKPGDHNYLMEIKAAGKKGNASVYSYGVYVSQTKFRKLSMFLKPEKLRKLQPDIIMEDWKPIEAIVMKEDRNKFCDGTFLKPTKGRISMLFGVREFINGKISGRHRGMDLAAHAGTPVVASNSGIVRLSKKLPSHGNTVVIDHGQGIFTYYAHLQKFAVKAGEKVKKGQLIGEVGMTGVATGPHLHFAISLHNLRVDPEQWLEGVIID